MKNSLLVILKSLLFWGLCVAGLVSASAVTNSISKPAGDLLSIALAFLIALILTFYFAQGKSLALIEAGVVPGERTSRRFLTGFLLGSALATLQPVLVILMGHLTISVPTSIDFMSILVNISLYLLVAGREELAFRGFPLRNIDKYLGPIVAQAIIAFIFILEHRLGGMSWFASVVGSGTGALFFGLAVIRTRGLALSFGLHASWNFVQWFWGFKPNTGVFHVVVEKGFEKYVERSGWISYLTVMGLGCMILLYFWKGQQVRRHGVE